MATAERGTDGLPLAAAAAAQRTSEAFEECLVCSIVNLNNGKTKQETRMTKHHIHILFPERSCMRLSVNNKTNYQKLFRQLPWQHHGCCNFTVRPLGGTVLHNNVNPCEDLQLVFIKAGLLAKNNELWI